MWESTVYFMCAYYPFSVIKSDVYEGFHLVKIWFVEHGNLEAFIRKIS